MPWPPQCCQYLVQPPTADRRLTPYWVLHSQLWSPPSRVDWMRCTTRHAVRRWVYSRASGGKSQILSWSRYNTPERKTEDEFMKGKIQEKGNKELSRRRETKMEVKVELLYVRVSCLCSPKNTEIMNSTELSLFNSTEHMTWMRHRHARGRNFDMT